MSSISSDISCCQGKIKSGRPCLRAVQAPQTHCHQHRCQSSVYKEEKKVFTTKVKHLLANLEEARITSKSMDEKFKLTDELFSYLADHKFFLDHNQSRFPTVVRAKLIELYLKHNYEPYKKYYRRIFGQSMPI